MGGLALLRAYDEGAYAVNYHSCATITSRASVFYGRPLFNLMISGVGVYMFGSMRMKAASGENSSKSVMRMYIRYTVQQ